MVLCDVSVLLYAFAPTTQHHDRCRKELQKLMASGKDFALSELVLAAVVRLATNNRIFKPAASAESVFKFVEVLRKHPRSVIVKPEERHWEVFRDLVAATGILGSDTTDAYFAALAIEHGCEWWTTDSDFAKFSGLHWRNLL